MTIERWFGIDFSGDPTRWAPTCARSNVWIAEVDRDADGLVLRDVRQVQRLPGPGTPFERLAALLAAGDYMAAGIDAPFSIPEPFVSRVGGHAALVALVGTQAVTGRPFMRGSEFVKVVTGVAPPLRPPKPLRHTDRAFAKLGVNTRSPLWTGARPGAPMTAACLTLLHRAARPIWPWATRGTGLLAEAFPAGQLRTWGLPHRKYEGASAAATRNTILRALSKRLRLGRWTSTLRASADALDAVLCAFGAIAIPNLPIPTFASAAAEGCVAVHP